MLAGVVKYLPDRCLCATHHAFHPVYGTQKWERWMPMAPPVPMKMFLLPLAMPTTSCGTDLADGEDEVVLAVAEEAIDLGGPGVIKLALAELVDEGAGDLAEGDDVIAPVVRTEKTARRLPEHGGYLVVGHGFVSSKGGEDVDQTASVELGSKLGEDATLRVHAGEIGWNSEHAAAGSDVIEGGKEVAAHLLWGHLSGWGAGGEEETHRG